MKNLTLIAIAFLGFTITSCSDNQEKKVEKKIEISADNGETEIQITTTVDGVTTEEKYSGEEAKKKLIEIEKEAEKLSNESNDSKKVVIKKETIEK